MRVFLVIGAVIDSGYVTYGVFSSRQEAQNFVDDNWVWYWTWTQQGAEDNVKVGSTELPKGYPKDFKPSGPDDYCNKDEVFIEEFEIGVPVELSHAYMVPKPWIKS